MASDNPAFVDTENTKGVGEEVKTGPKAAVGEETAAVGDAGAAGVEAAKTTAAAADASKQAETDNCQREGEATRAEESENHGDTTGGLEEKEAQEEEQSSDKAEEPAENIQKNEKLEKSIENGLVAVASAVVAEKAVEASVDLEAAAGGGKGGSAGSKLPEYPPGEAGRMLRNAMGVGVVFMVHFTATLGVTHLQSSVNKKDGLGTSALAAQYAGLVLSSLLLSVFLINKLGCKWTMVLAILANVPYMAAQMYPRVYTLVPAAFLMGMAIAPLWSAKCTYLCVISEARSALTSRPLKAVRDQVIGLFFMVFLLSMIWGNLVSSLVLSHGEDKPKNVSVEGICGVDFCPSAAGANPNLERPPQEKITLIIGIYIGFMLLGCLIAACYVDSLKRYSEGSRANSASGLSTMQLLTVTLALHRRKEMLLMVPLSVWLGVDYAFVEAEYTASFVACAWGISNIGYVIIVYGAFNSLLALITGWVVARVGRRPVLCVAAVLHAALMGGTLAWRPSADHKALFFVVAALWGAADGHWCVQLNSLYAILFPNMEEAAYSNFRLWQSVGFLIAFSYSHHLCTIYKLYVVIGLLVLGVAGYLCIEYTRPRKARLLDE